MGDFFRKAGKVGVTVCVVGTSVLLASFVQSLASEITSKALDTIISDLKKPEEKEAASTTEGKETLKAVA
jgi:hypothetical protein